MSMQVDKMHVNAIQNIDTLSIYLFTLFFYLDTYILILVLNILLPISEQYEYLQALKTYKNGKKRSSDGPTP